MATSGSYDFSITRDDIIKEALDIIGEYSPSESIEPSDITTCARTLNLMIKHFQSLDYGLWLIQHAELFLQKDTVEYDLGPTGDHASLVSDTVKSELAADSAITDTTLTVDSITGFADEDIIGTELDSGTVDWDVATGDPAGTTVTITTGLAGAAATNNHVYGYTTKIQRPLDIIEIRRKQEDDVEIPMTLISRTEYMQQAIKTTTGQPTIAFYDPQLTNGTLSIWPEPESVKTRLRFSMKRPVEDFDAGTNDCDFPQEWQAALVYNLAIWISPKYSRKVTEEMMAIAAMTLDNASGWDKEHTPVRIKSPVRTRHMRM